MRLTSFIVGSVLGMAGAMVLMQKKPAVAQSFQGAMSEVKNTMVNKAMDKFTKGASQTNSQSQTKQQGQAQSNHMQTSSSNQANSNTSNHQMNVSMIEGIIKSDPELSTAVQQIKGESSSITKH